MSNTNSKASFLKLVVVNNEEMCEKETIDWHENVQYDLFGSSNTLLYLEVRAIDISDIKDLVEEFQVRHILDLRDVPYLNFGRSSRNSFFDFIDRRSIDYLSLNSVASKTRKSSINDFLEDDSSFNMWIHEFSSWIERGPTLALTNNDKENDTAVKSLTEQLSKLNISYSEY